MKEIKKQYDAPDVAVIDLESQGVFASSTESIGAMSILDWTEEDSDLTF